MLETNGSFSSWLLGCDLPCLRGLQVLAAVGSVVARNRQLEDMVRRMTVSESGVADSLHSQGHQRARAVQMLDCCAAHMHL